MHVTERAVCADGLAGTAPAGSCDAGSRTPIFPELVQL